MAQKYLNFVVGAQKNEEGRIVPAKEEGAQLEADAHFPQPGRVQFPDTQAGMLPWVGQRRAQIREDVKDGGAFLRADAEAASQKFLL
jgi:hypothetical protein